MLGMDIIEPSSSEWCSPVVLVPKKDGGLRFCVDFSKLNAVSTFDPYPMPRADKLIERLGKAAFLTTLDLCKGYWQGDVYHFKVMAFGLHGAAATFQRLMDKVLRGTEEYAAAYIDDVIVYRATWEEHLKHLTDVVQRLAAAGLTISPAKCSSSNNQEKGEIIPGVSWMVSAFYP